MALKQLLLNKKIAAKKAELEELRTKQADIQTRRDAMKKREEDLEAAVQEITEETEQEAKDAVDEAVAQFEADMQAIDQEATENGEAIDQVEAAVQALQEELDAIEETVAQAAQQVEETVNPTDNEGTERSVTIMNTRKFFGMSTQERSAFFAREDVKSFAKRVREMGMNHRAVNGGALLIPEVILGLIREQVGETSKLLPYVNSQVVGGKARQIVMGTVPEAVWTEMCANLNEMDLVFNDAEVDGYKVGAYISLCNALKEDNDVALVEQVIYALARGIGRALDKAILYGTGTKMPLGIVTRLAQSSAPADYRATARAWVDLRSTNIAKITAANSTGIKLFQGIGTAFAAAKGKYGNGGKFFAMNAKTHMLLVTEAMNFNAAGAIVTGINDLMPVLGGDIVEIEDIPDNNIIAGYGDLYLLAERAGVEVAESEHAKFIEDKTVYKATARYDGLPVIAEGFVVIGINNTDATTSLDFAADAANSVQTITLNTETATVAVSGTIKLQAFTAPGNGTVTWTSGTTAKATVADDGTVTGVAAGTSVITAACNGLTASCTVTVTSA